MQAIVIARPGGPDVLELREVPTPEPGVEQVRVRVRATAVNRADLLQRAGAYPAPPGVPADIPGLEFAGEVDAVGPEARAWRPGDRVFGLAGGGTYAEYVVCHERLLARIPDELDWTTAAAVPEAFITAHDALITLGGATLGTTVLVHAVGSGVGIAAVQLARALGGRVLGTARTPDKLERARAYGLDVPLAPDDFAAAALAATHDRGVAVVIDFVGAAYLAENLRALAPRGRLVVVGLLGGASEPLDLGLVLRKRLTVVGTVLRARPLEEKIAATRAFDDQVVPLLRRGVVRAVVDRVLPLRDARAAHEVVGANANFGKVVLAL
jgi:putative PIG3 family NAD(P)H quinone oxidoreductase